MTMRPSSRFVKPRSEHDDDDVGNDTTEDVQEPAEAGRHLTRYMNAVREMDRCAALKKRRVASLRALWNDKDEAACEYLIDQDQEARTWQVLRDRAAARAAALGPAALLEAMGKIR